MYKIILLLNNLYFLFIKAYTYCIYYSAKLYNNLHIKFNKNSYKNNIFYVKNTIEYDDNNIIIHYDFIIYKYLVEDKETITVINKNIFNIMDNIDNIDNMNIMDINVLFKNYIPKLTEYKFILVKIIFNDIIYDITNIIKSKNNFFYVVNNKLFDKYFMNWFCKKYLNINYDSSMYIELFDNLLNKYIINSNNYIILETTKFKLM